MPSLIKDYIILIAFVFPFEARVEIYISGPKIDVIRFAYISPAVEINSR